MNAAEFKSRNEVDTDHLGAALASLLPPRAIIALIGTLGAGKTRFVQAVATSIGISREDVTSPTFVICQHYRGGTQVVHHLDAYRVRDEDEWFELGVDELFERPGWTFVEWADRFEEFMPQDYLRIEIEVLGESERIFRVQSIGSELVSVVETMKKTDLKQLDAE